MNEVTVKVDIYKVCGLYAAEAWYEGRRFRAWGTGYNRARSNVRRKVLDFHTAQKSSPASGENHWVDSVWFHV